MYFIYLVLEVFTACFIYFTAFTVWKPATGNKTVFNSDPKNVIFVSEKVTLCDDHSLNTQIRSDQSSRKQSSRPVTEHLQYIMIKPNNINVILICFQTH